MKIFEVTGQMPQQTTKMKVVQATPNKVTLQDPQNPQTQTTFDPSKNPNAIQQSPQGIVINPTADPNAPKPMPQLQPGSEVDMAGALDAPSQPGSPLTPNPKPNQQNQPTAEVMDDDVDEMVSLKKLAGVKEADAGETDGRDVPPMPNISGLQPGQPKDLGDGTKIEIGRDGNIHYSGGFGRYVYSPQGKPLSYNSPSLAGLGMAQDFNTGNLTTSYSAGPMRANQTTNAKGQMLSKNATYRIGDADMSVDQEYKDGQPTIQTRSTRGSGLDGSFANYVNMSRHPDVLNRARQAMPTDEVYTPVGYNDKNREKAMMRKAMKNVTQDTSFINESSDIVKLAKMITGSTAKSKDSNIDLDNLKNLAGL